MKTPDLHPDELLDRDTQGELSDSERLLLDAHLAQCKVCRFEQEARLDFKDELMAGSPDVELLVAKVLAGGHVTVPPPAIVAHRRRRAAPFLLGSVAAAMLFAGVAVAGGWSGVWPRLLSPSSAPPPPAVVAPPPLPGPVSPPAPHFKPAMIAPSPPVIETESPIEQPAPRITVDRQPALAPSPIVAVPQAAPQAAEAAKPDDADAIFARANRERTRGQHADAVRSYRELLTRFPDAPETHLSRATLGRLLLDDGDATGALEQLDRYLHDGDSTLREEAMESRAIALGRLGRTTDEAAAWSALLDSYPQSIHGARARARIRELGSR